MATSSSSEDDDDMQPQEASDSHVESGDAEDEGEGEEGEEEGDEEEEVEEEGEKEEEHEERDNNEEEEEDEGGGGEEVGNDDEEEREEADSPDSSASVSAAAADVNDNSQEVDSDGNGMDSGSVCSTYKKSEVKIASHSHHIEDCQGNVISDDHSNELTAAQTNLGSFQENKILGTPLENTSIGSLTEKRTLTEVSENIKGDSNEAQDNIKGDSNEAPESIQAPLNDGAKNEHGIEPIIGDDIKRGTSSLLTPQQRPRSLTPDAEFEDKSKRPAIVCDFFARGWCIKGNSCRFRHQKVGVDDNTIQTKEDLASSTGGGEIQEDSGLRPKAERSGLSTSMEPSLPLQEDLSKFDITRGKLFEISLLEKLSPHFKPNDSRSFEEELISRQHLQTVNIMHHEMPKRDLLNDGERFTTRWSILESRPFSTGPLVPSGIYGKDRTINESAVPRSSFIASLSPTIQSTCISSPHHIFSLPGTSTRGTTPLSAEHFNAQKLLDSDERYPVSRSTSLPRSSSPYYSRSDLENMSLHNTSAISVGSKTQSYSYDWEPSIPFRSSFYRAPTGMSSPGSQYDPIRDSIEPPNGRNRFLHASFTQGPILDNASHLQTNIDLVSSILSRTSGYNAETSPHSFFETHDSSPGKNIYGHEVGENRTGVGPTGIHLADGGNESSMPKEDKTFSPSHIVDGSKVKEVNVDRSSKHQTDKGRHDKDSKTMKLFHAALVDFVKELVKPAWREGHLSKDAHKMIVKKAVDKVLSTLRSHQIPSNTESIKQYLSSSRQKLAKLVEGYVDKYANAKT